jgi:hypothetical protein
VRYSARGRITRQTSYTRHGIPRCAAKADRVVVLAEGGQEARQPFARQPLARAAPRFLAAVFGKGQLTSALYLDKPVEVEEYMRIMDQLHLDAKPPWDTKKLLSQILADI